MKITIESYVCTICKRRNIKLWHPKDEELLICAECAEKRQKLLQYKEIKWKKEKDGSQTGTYTGRSIQLPKWEVNEEGNVPSYDGPGPNGLPAYMTDILIVDLSDVSTLYSSGYTIIVPAYPNENGSLENNAFVSENILKWWKDLPTR